MYQTLVPIIPPKIHPVLVKPLRFMLSSLQQQIRPLKVKIWERVRPNPMPQNNIFLNHLLTMLLEGRKGSYASQWSHHFVDKVNPL